MSATSGGAPHDALIAVSMESMVVAKFIDDEQAAGVYQSEERWG